MDTFEKRYNEALERARKMMDSKRSVVIGKQALEAIFPELRESEDERIRKAIIKSIEEDSSVYEQEVSKEQMLAYLEKQKEQDWNKKPCLTCQEYEKGHKQGYTEGCTAGYNKAMKEAEQKEQKPSCWDSPVMTHEMVMDEQKPAEVDESTKRLNENWMKQYFDEQKPVEIHIDNPNVQKFDPDVKVTTSDSSADGKELLYVSNKSYKIGYRDGVASVKPVEWSEEDEDMLNSCISSIEEAKENRYAYKETDGDTSYDHEIAWLKSLRRPKSSDNWKPSEDQMNVLLNAEGMVRANGCPENAKVLASLYEQLKKLI